MAKVTDKRKAIQIAPVSIEDGYTQLFILYDDGEIGIRAVRYTEETGVCRVPQDLAVRPRPRVEYA